MNEHDGFETSQEPLPKQEAAHLSQQQEDISTREARLREREEELETRLSSLGKDELDISNYTVPSDPEYLPTPSPARAIESDKDIRVAAFHHQSHSGPLPSPETFRADELAHPGTAERILQRFEKQSDHRMTMERKVIESNTFSQKAGVNWAGILAFVAIVGGIFLAFEGKSFTGLTMFIGAIASLVGTNLYSRHAQTEERRELRNALQSSSDEEEDAPNENDSSEKI